MYSLRLKTSIFDLVQLYIKVIKTLILGRMEYNL